MKKLYFWYAQDGPIKDFLWVTTEENPEHEIVLEIQIDEGNSAEMTIFALVEQATQLKAGSTHLGTMIAMFLSKAFISGANWQTQNPEKKIVSPF